MIRHRGLCTYSRAPILIYDPMNGARLLCPSCGQTTPAADTRKGSGRGRSPRP